MILQARLLYRSNLTLEILFHKDNHHRWILHSHVLKLPADGLLRHSYRGGDGVSDVC